MVPICVRPTRQLKIKDLRPIRGPNLRRSAIKKITISEVIFLDPMRGGIGRDRSRTLHAAIKKMGIRVEGGAEPGDEGYKENFYNFAEKNKLLLR